MVFIEYFLIFSVTKFLNQSVPSCDDIMIKDLPRIKLVKANLLPELTLYCIGSHKDNEVQDIADCFHMFHQAQN